MAPKAGHQLYRESTTNPFKIGNLSSFRKNKTTNRKWNGIPQVQRPVYNLTTVKSGTCTANELFALQPILVALRPIPSLKPQAENLVPRLVKNFRHIPLDERNWLLSTLAAHHKKLEDPSGTQAQNGHRNQLTCALYSQCFPKANSILHRELLELQDNCTKWQFQAQPNLQGPHDFAVSFLLSKALCTNKRIAWCYIKTTFTRLLTRVILGGEICICKSNKHAL